MHVENFLNDVQREKMQQGKLLYIPGPPSVIEESLLCGFVGRNEQTGHPSQKPLSVIEKTLLMATARGELAIDLMSGSGTTGEACMANARYGILCDIFNVPGSQGRKTFGIAHVLLNESILSPANSQKHRLPQSAVSLPKTHPCIPARCLRGRSDQMDLEIR